MSSNHIKIGVSSNHKKIGAWALYIITTQIIMSRDTSQVTTNTTLSLDQRRRRCSNRTGSRVVAIRKVLGW